MEKYNIIFANTLQNLVKEINRREGWQPLGAPFSEMVMMQQDKKKKPKQQKLYFQAIVRETSFPYEG